MPARGLVQDAFEKEAVLGRLMRKLPDYKLRARVQQIAEERAIPEERVELYLQDLYKLSLPVDHSGLHSFCSRMSSMIKQVHPRCAVLVPQGMCSNWRTLFFMLSSAVLICHRSPNFQERYYRRGIALQFAQALPCNLSE